MQSLDFGVDMTRVEPCEERDTYKHNKTSLTPNGNDVESKHAGV